MAINSLTPDIMVKLETFKIDIFEAIKFFTNKQIDASLLIQDVAITLSKAKQDLPEDKFHELVSFANSLLKDINGEIYWP